MKVQLKKGLIEAYVLHILLKEPSYGYKLYIQILDDIMISENTLYPIFKRLEKDKLVEAYSEEHNGRLRKYYKITNEGIEKLEEFKESFKDIKKIMNKIIEGEAL